MFIGRNELKEVKGVLHKVLGHVRVSSGVIKVLERRVMQLEEREKELLDRLMAKDYGEFVLGRNVQTEERVEERELPLDAQEDSAGMALEIRE